MFEFTQACEIINSYVLKPQTGLCNNWITFKSNMCIISPWMLLTCTVGSFDVNL